MFKSKALITVLVVAGITAHGETRIGEAVMQDTCVEFCNLEFWQSATPQTLKETLANGANVNAHDARGDTPLHWASASNTPELAEILINAGAVVNVINEAGFTPLSVALDSENLELMKVLLRNGANLFERVDQGGSLLHSAISWQHEEIVEYLLDAGLSPLDTNTKGNTPLQVAAHRQNTTIMAMLIDRLDPLLTQVMPENNIDHTNWNGETALHWAVFFGDSGLEVTQMLLDAGADPNIQDENGRASLHKAVRVGSPVIVSLLLQFGADASLLDRDGKTPFDLSHENNRLAGTDIFNVLEAATLN